MTPARGEVWLFDLGMAEKVRPALVISAAFGDADRALVTIVPHTTSLRGSQFEIPTSVPFLKPGAFLVQGISTYPRVRAIRRLGASNPISLTRCSRVFCDGLVKIGSSIAGIQSCNRDVVQAVLSQLPAETRPSRFRVNRRSRKGVLLTLGNIPDGDGV